MSEIFKDLSVIVPFVGHDYYWKDLLSDLRPLPKDSEIILVGPDEPDADILARARECLLCDVRYVKSEKGRGVQLNNGTRASNKKYFWFLHADSKVPRTSLFKLGLALVAKPQALHFFDLKFLDDGPRVMTLNSMAANWRSQHLGMPFGDQGFAISRLQFYRIGGFSESCRTGEDHTFVWDAHRRRIEVNRISAPIFTSARRYEAEGWSRLTSLRVLKTMKQASFEFIKLVKQRAVEPRV